MKKMKVYKVEYLGNDFKTWEFERVGLKGVGKDKLPIINMDRYVDNSQDDELHHECCVGLALSDRMKMGVFAGEVPPFEREKRGGIGSWAEMVRKLDQFDKDGIHDKNMRRVVDKSNQNDRLKNICKYAYFAMGADIPWFFTVYLMSNLFRNKTEQSLKTEDDAKHFPMLMDYIQTLPFKNLGRALFFATYPGVGVITHRDAPMRPHKDHNINFFFNKSRPSYVWDDINEKKVYLDEKAKTYFFNNRDYHGVDPEDVFRYTLRVDGTFTEELQDELKLTDGYTWCEDYE